MFKTSWMPTYTNTDSNTSFLPIYSPLLVQVQYEVFGDFKRILFSQCTKEVCDKLGVKGWVMPSRRGTIIGQIQGDKERVDEVALWLRLQGSPGSKIEHAQFSNWQLVDDLSYRNFNIRF